MSSPNAIDLVTIAQAAEWGNFPSAVGGSPDPKMVDILQEIITGFSDFVLWRTGRAANYFVGTPGQSGPPNVLSTYNEVRNGNDGDSIGVMNGPIGSVISVQVFDQVYGPSTAWNVMGYFVSSSDPHFISLRGGGGFLQGFGNPFSPGRRGRFTHGQGNVLLSYTGGYTSCPPDLFEKTLRVVTTIANKRLREDESSRTTPQTGAVSGYRQYPYDKDILWTIDQYKRQISTFG